MLSLKPQSNPTNAYENLINEAKDNLKIKIYDKENVENIVRTLFNFKDDPELFFKKFNYIPLSLLEIIASNLPAICAELIDIYTSTTEKHFRESRISFEDAELVANAMLKIYEGTKDLGTKIKAMRMTLFSSVWCNRYSAMDVFDQMLKDIKDDQEAVAINEMLKENLEFYQHLAGRVPSTELHSIIQFLQKQIQDDLEQEKINRLKEIDEW